MHVHCMNVNEYLIVVDFCTHFMYVGSCPVKSGTMRHNWDPFQQYHSTQWSWDIMEQVYLCVKYLSASPENHWISTDSTCNWPGDKANWNSWSSTEHMYKVMHINSVQLQKFNFLHNYILPYSHTYMCCTHVHVQFYSVCTTNTRQFVFTHSMHAACKPKLNNSVIPILGHISLVNW